jgi:hypothetical protein
MLNMHVRLKYVAQLELQSAEALQVAPHGL